MADRPKRDAPRGVLRTPARFEHRRYLPSSDLASHVEHYWLVRWDLRGMTPHRQSVLPHPSVHLTFEAPDPSAALVNGVVSGRFDKVLEGQGAVFGIKLRPGAAHGLLRAPISTLTDRVVRLSELLDDAPPPLDPDQLDAAPIPSLEAFVRALSPTPLDASARRARAAVERAASDREILRARALAAAFDTSERSLQRLFRTYVGVSPKWVIRRYRLHEALAALDAGGGPDEAGQVDLADLAARLGYTDQAHFTKDFRALVGEPPGRYLGGA